MPNRDGTGPSGNGPTGKCLGNCTSDASNTELQQFQFNKNGGMGRGCGNGRSRNSDQCWKSKIDSCYELLNDLQQKIDILSKQEPKK